MNHVAIIRQSALAASIAACSLNWTSDAAAAPVEIGFDDATNSGGVLAGTTTEDGFEYSLFSGAVISTNINAGRELQGRTTGPGGVIEIVSATPGQTFNFISIEIAEFDRAGDQAFAIQVQGLFNGGVVGTEQLLPQPENANTLGLFSTALATPGGLLGDEIDQLLITLPAGQLDAVPPDFAGRVNGVVVEVVPEPSSLALLGLGGLLVVRRRR
ncbi:MAG: PEP-CTERM sorting domain-containing protein [Planctomycetota bacterium]